MRSQMTSRNTQLSSDRFIDAGGKSVGCHLLSYFSLSSFAREHIKRCAHTHRVLIAYSLPTTTEPNHLIRARNAIAIALASCPPAAALGSPAIRYVITRLTIACRPVPVLQLKVAADCALWRRTNAASSVWMRERTRSLPPPPSDSFLVT